MRVARVKVEGRSAVYHCISRVVGGQRLLDDTAKEVLRKQIHYMADFCGVQVLGYCLMSNHFHLLVRVPDALEVTDDELIRRFELLYRKEPEVVKAFTAKLQVGGEEADLIRKQLLARMGDVSNYLKELKQRFSIWYNRSHKRFGTLWAERFKSVLIEDKHAALRTVMAYIDLNPVRAGMVEDPKDYRFCGYAELMAGKAWAVKSLCHVLESNDRPWALNEYRKLLFLYGASPHKQSRIRISPERVREVIDAGGRVSAPELLRLRVRYFSDGVVLGSRAFVDAYFQAHRHEFGPKRKEGAKRMRGFPEMAVLRGLRRSVFS